MLVSCGMLLYYATICAWETSAVIVKWGDVHVSFAGGIDCMRYVAMEVLSLRRSTYQMHVWWQPTD